MARGGGNLKNWGRGRTSCDNYQDIGKRGLGLGGGVAFMTVLAVLMVLAVLEGTLPSLCLSYGGSVMTATPLKLSPLLDILT